MKKIKNVAVVGAGTMGHALALVHSIGGINVTLQDVDAVRLNAAPKLINSALSTLINANDVEEKDRASVNDRISLETDLGKAVADADLIVEAVVEDRDVKREVYRNIDASAKDDVILASNTSYLDVFPLIPPGRQSRSLITHWYTPPYIIDLVDLAPGPETDPAIVEHLRALYQSLGKQPVVFGNLIPGYIANRLQAAMNLEVFRLLDEGMVTIENIDDSVRHGLALRWALLGLLKKADYTGLDMTQRSLKNRMYTPPQPTGASSTVDALIDAGRTGVTSGAGFYDYEGQSTADLFQDRDLRLLKLKQALQHIESE